jgi:hypothetical protein
MAKLLVDEQNIIAKYPSENNFFLLVSRRTMSYYNYEQEEINLERERLHLSHLERYTAATSQRFQAERALTSQRFEEEKAVRDAEQALNAREMEMQRRELEMQRRELQMQRQQSAQTTQMLTTRVETIETDHVRISTEIMEDRAATLANKELIHQVEGLESVRRADECAMIVLQSCVVLPPHRTAAVAYATDRYTELLTRVRGKISTYRAIQSTVANPRISEQRASAVAHPASIMAPCISQANERIQGIYAVRCNGQIRYFPYGVSHQEAMTLVIADILTFKDERQRTRFMSLDQDPQNAPIREGVLYPCTLYNIM